MVRAGGRAGVAVRRAGAVRVQRRDESIPAHVVRRVAAEGLAAERSGGAGAAVRARAAAARSGGVAVGRTAARVQRRDEGLSADVVRGAAADGVAADRGA